MKLVAGEIRENFYGQNELRSADLALHCKNEEEFMAAWEKIKDIDGVFWCGCPAEEDGKYIDLVAVVKKKGSMSNSDVYAARKDIRDEIESTLGIGKFRRR